MIVVAAVPGPAVVQSVVVLVRGGVAGITHRQNVVRTVEQAPPVLAIYGQESENVTLADELALDGYDVRLVNDPAPGSGVDLIVFAHASRRDTAFACLRALRQGALAGSGARVLWISATTNVTDTLRAFEAGADDVIRAPFVYAELLGVNFNSRG